MSISILFFCFLGGGVGHYNSAVQYKWTYNVLSLNMISMQVKSWQINLPKLSIQWLSNYEFIYIDDTKKKGRNGWISSPGHSAGDTQENNAARTVGGQSTVHCVGGRGG